MAVRSHFGDRNKMDLEQLVKSVKEVEGKVEEQNEVIGLLQAEVEFQNDRITAQDKVIKELTAKVEALTKTIAETHLSSDMSPKSPNAQSSSRDLVNEEDVWKQTSSVSIADQAKEIAEKTLMTNLGFIFDPNTKLYCNYSTGYYYDPAQQLYYNGHTGTYYTFDEKSQEYRFHSQIEIPDLHTSQSEKKTKRTTHSRKRTVKESTENRKSIDSVIVSDEGKAERKKVLKVRRPILTASTNERTDNGIEKDVGLTTAEETISTKIDLIDQREDPEEGELSQSSKSEESESDENSSNNSSNDTNNHVEHDEQYPPCIRAIITESSSEEIKTGSLYLVTCMGGTIGREGNEHALTLPDSLVEKTHAQIHFAYDPSSEDTTEKYFITDLGSRHGTFLNGKRLSNEKEKSDPHEILHGSLVKISGFTILLHIHPGSFTCGHCEPGLLMNANENCNKTGGVLLPESASRQAMMRRIKKKYGIDRPLKSKELPDAEKYKDRAQERRIIKGSDNPFEKTQVATLEAPISESNKGFEMLKKMGWNKGKSLGQSSQGIAEPIPLEPKNDRGGLGLESELVPTSLSQISTLKSNSNDQSKNFQRIKKSEKMAITMRRFKQAEQQSADSPDHN